MRKINLFIASSLEGYIAREDDSIDWLYMDGDYGYTQFYDSVDTILMDRRTYDKVLEFGAGYPHKDEKLRKFYIFLSQNDSMKEEIHHSSIRDEDVYTLLTKIPPGKVSTYGDIANALGHPGASRAIGRIIANNPNPITVPCHRVVKSNGEIGGFMYGEQRKREILEREGIRFQNRVVENFQETRFILNKQIKN